MFNFRCAHVPRTTAFNPTLPSIRVNGHSFHAETFGDPASPPLIVLHGGPGGDYSCLLSLAMLSDEYHVLFYDQRGSGLSPREDHPDPSMEAFVRDLDSLVDLHGMGKKMRLIGHSWGRIMVTAYLTRHPYKVSQIPMRRLRRCSPTPCNRTLTGWGKSPGRSTGVHLSQSPSSDRKAGSRVSFVLLPNFLSFS